MKKLCIPILDFLGYVFEVGCATFVRVDYQKIKF